MRKLRVFESISVDGYFTDARGDMGFAHGTDPDFAAWVGRNAGGGGELLFGRKTYEMMAAFWPTPVAAAQMPEVARGMNAATKYVVSRSLEVGPDSLIQRAAAALDPIEELEREARMRG